MAVCKTAYTGSIPVGTSNPSLYKERLSVKTSPPATIGSLFSGYGGLDLAVETVFPNASVRWYSEIEPHACTVLTHHLPRVPNLGNATTIDWTTPTKVDILTAGYPCQPFSSAGLRRGKHDERHLWPHVLRAIISLRPRLVVLENVTGHLSLGFDQVKCDLENAGWVVRHGVFSAKQVGAVHTRKRLFVVAWMKSDDVRDVLDDLGFSPYAVRRIEDVKMLPTPTASDHKRTGSAGDQRRKSPPLPAYSVHFPHVLPDQKEYGEFTLTVRQWESLTRPAPAPVEDTPRGWRTNIDFVEWCMGLPSGHVTTTDVPRTGKVKMLGNGVVPQQAAFAITQLFLGECDT